MKKAFTIALAALALAAPANAVDYTQCEAMQRASTRLENSHSKVRSSIHDMHFDQKWQSCKGHGKKTLQACLDSYEAQHWPTVELALQMADAKHAKRIAPVRADYQAAGCY